MTTVKQAPGIQVHPVLLDRLIRSTIDGLSMANRTPTPVGASKYGIGGGELTVLVGLIGEYTGTLTLSCAKSLAIDIAGGMLGESHEDVTEDVLDAIGEVGNIVAGSFKDLMLGTEMAFSNIGVPAVILGPSYNLYYYRGFQTVSTSFEIEEFRSVNLPERLMQVSVALMKR